MSDLDDLRKLLLEKLENLPDPPRLAPFLNRKIDAIFHPLAEKDKRALLIDTALHFLVETADSLAHSTVKAARYNLKRLVEEKKR